VTLNPRSEKAHGLALRPAERAGEMRLRKGSDFGDTDVVAAATALKECK
jgi:hypothetical protein